MINFEDDCMNRSRTWMEELIQGMMEMKTRPDWGFRGRVEKFDAVLAKSLAGAGCRRVNFGVESGDETVQQQIGKQIRIEQARQAISAAKQAGIATVCYFMFGFPHETEAQMKKTIDFALSARPDYAQFTPVVLLPGTSLYRREQERQPSGFDPYRDFTLHPTQDFRPPTITDSISQKRIFKIARWAYFRYYFSLGFLFSGKGALGGLFRGIKAGISLLQYILWGPKSCKEKMG